MTTAEEVRWDLTPLYPGADGRSLDDDLAAAIDEAHAFAERHRGRVADLDGPSMADAVAASEAIQERVVRAATYAYLRFATGTNDPERGALLQSVSERATAVENEMLFFALEWTEVPDEQAEQLLADPALDPWRHHLAATRRFRPHLRTEPEEKILAEKGVTGRQAWVRLFSQVSDAVEVALDEGTVPLETALSKLYDADRAVRQAAGAAITEALRAEPGLAVRTYVFNAVLSDHALDDRLRAYPSWISSRNMGNEIDDAMVDALVGSVTGRYDLPARWYGLKRRLLGLDELTEHDRYAPLLADEREISWDDARTTVLDAYRSFSPELADLAGGFFDGYIDAPVVPGKQGGAFAHPAVPSAHPYVMLNFTGRRRDVMTMAHELGHGVHQVLASSLGVINADTPLTLAETASIFGETVTFGRLLADESDPKGRLALLAGRLEDVFASVFRQIAMNRFEDAVHTIRRAEGELSPERFGIEWLRTQRAMFGDSVRLTDEYGPWWSYIPHFIHTPGYVYAYAFGNLLALAVYARYEADGAAFVPSYLELLSAGGSQRPDELARIVGVDLTDPTFWDSGLDVIAGMVDEAEALADQVGPLAP